MIWKDDNKCDDRDAKMLARIAKFDVKLLHLIKHNQRTARVDLAIVKARDVLVKAATLIMNHVRGSLLSFGVKTTGVTAANFTNMVVDIIFSEISEALNGLIE